MPEDKDATPAPDSGGGAKLFSLKGWIIVGCILLVQAMFFCIIIWFKDTPPEQVKETTEENTGTPPEDLLRKVPIAPLTYTLFTPGQGSATFRLEVVLELGTTREERENPKIMPNAQQMEQFKSIVDSYLDRLRDHLNSYIPRLGINILQGPNGQQYVTDEIRRFLNDGLKEMNIKDIPPGISRERVTKVLVRDFLFQPN